MGLSVADHGYVLETGRIVLGGKPDELWGNEAIRAAYLGGHAKVKRLRRGATAIMVTIQVQNLIDFVAEVFRPCRILARRSEAHRDLSDHRQSHRP